MGIRPYIWESGRAVLQESILNTFKQFHQKFLSKHEQMTPNFVDKYYAKAEDAVSADATSSSARLAPLASAL